MNTGYGMPSRRRVRGPLHPRQRTSLNHFTDLQSASDHDQDSQRTHLPSSLQELGTVASGSSTSNTAAAGKKREWTSTIGRNGLGSLPWDQMNPTTSLAASEVPRAEFSFQSNMPTSQSATSMASMPSNSSLHSFTSFRQAQTPISSASTSSPTSFRTAADAEESFASRGVIFSRGHQSAQAALRENSDVYQDRSDGPAPKRRRGLAGTIVDTALNAALFTGAAALTAYSLWSSWSQGADPESEQHTAAPEQEQEPGLGAVVSRNKSGQVEPKIPGGLEEPPPPYAADDIQASPATPRTQSARMRRVFVSSQRNRRRPTFQGNRAPRQSTPRRGLPEAFRQDSPSVTSHTDAVNGTPSAASGDMDRADQNDADGDDDDDDDDEQDEVMQRFQDRMNALIAEGQAALNSTPVLQDSDLVDIEAPSPSLALAGSRSTPRLFTEAQDDIRAVSPFQLARSGSGGIANVERAVQDASGPNQPAYLPEPVKRSFSSHDASLPSLHKTRSNLSFNFNDSEPTADGTSTDASREARFRAGRASSPFIFGRPPASSSPADTPSRKARPSDFGYSGSTTGYTREANHANGSPYSRIPVSSSSLQSRKSLDPKLQ